MKRYVVLVVGAAALATSAVAGEMPKEIAAAVRKLGPVINPPETLKLFAPLQKKEPYTGVNVTRDEKYGPAERNRLDLFEPAKRGDSLPVLVFVHGGGFTGGDKKGVGNSPFYDNIALWAVANGMVGVNITYRLAPENPYPAGAQDVGLAIQWLAQNVQRFGGNPRRLFLMGHSAGAVHVATYVAHPEFQKIPGGGLAAAILLSGIYEFTPDTDQPAQRAYFGDDLSKWDERSSLKGLVQTKLPILLMRGELDPGVFSVQAEVLNGAMCAAPRGCPTYVVLKDHSHMSEVYAINTEDTRVSDPIRTLVRSFK
ncbi:MAG TPA: alpha/beta hydrolase [Reyranella sp.]|jgi:triacylglycerol lipase|nr:alpha/beta hydrolase [Reyranella sp.]